MGHFHCLSLAAVVPCAGSLKPVGALAIPRRHVANTVGRQQRRSEQSCGLHPAHYTGVNLSGNSLFPRMPPHSLPTPPGRLSRWRQFSEIDPKDNYPEAIVDIQPICIDDAHFYMQAAGELTSREVEHPLVEPEAASETPVEDRFFNRPSEMQWLQNRVNRKPNDVIVLVGPKDTGKSRFLKEFVAMNKERTIYLDGGTTTIDTPGAMAAALRVAVNQISLTRLGKARYFEFLLTVMQNSDSTNNNAIIPLMKAVAAAITGVWAPGKKNDLSSIQESYKSLLKRLPEFDPLFNTKCPVIIIDEFNKLRLWESLKAEAKEQEERSRLLSGFLDFLKRMSKQENKCHIILASSESAMVSWLSKEGIGENVRRVAVMGDLSYQEASTFVSGGVVKDKNGDDDIWPGIIKQSTKTPEMDDLDWKKVYSACGGNINLLSKTVSTAIIEGSWDKALDEFMMEVDQSVEDALYWPQNIRKPEGGGDALWRAVHYRAAIELILQNQYHAVPMLEMVEALSKVKDEKGRCGVGADLLKSMVEWNVLSMRPYFELARDIPREAFGPEKKRVVTMPSPAHLLAAIKLRKQGIL